MKQDDNKKLPFREDPEKSSKVICHYIDSIENDNPMYGLLYDDLLWKTSKLRKEAKYYYLTYALKKYLPNKQKEGTKMAMDVKNDIRKYLDVLIVTIIEQERQSALLSFGINPESHENINIDGIRIWETNLYHSSTRSELKLGICMVGEARTLPCAIACIKIFTSIKVHTAILIGIAAGLKEKVSTGDVVIAETIIDYEGKRITEEGEKKRPVSLSPPHSIKRDMHYLTINGKQWKKRINKIAKDINIEEEEKEIFNNTIPKFDYGVILSGEKLLDGIVLPLMREEYHDKVRAGEMEGSGFARACDEEDIEWLVFRGISDYGDGESIKIRSKFKRYASLAAAILAKHFLENTYRKAEEKEF